MPVLSRRRITTAALWGAPAVAVAAAAPASAASVTEIAIITEPMFPMQYVGETVALPIVATDQDGNQITGGTWTAEGLPAGLVINPDGTISGVPTVDGEHTVTVTLTVGGVSESKEFTLPVGNDRAAVTARMLERLNEHRASIGVGPLTRVDELDANIEPWVEKITADGTGLVHQNPGQYAENLSATCGQSGSLGGYSDVELGGRLVEGWIGEPHSYADYKALLDAGKTDEARDMFHGTGAYAAVGASGHRINLENPEYSEVGVAMAASILASACGRDDLSTGEIGGIVLR